MKTGIVQNNIISTAGNRLDSKFHLSDGIYTRRFIMQSPYSLKTVGYFSSNIFYGNRAKRIYVHSQDKGIPFIGSSDMLKSDISGVKLISRKYTHSLSDLTLKKDWILISRSGTIGNTVYTNGLFENKIGSEHIIRVIPNSSIYSGFLYSYLSSKYGYSLLTQGTFGAVIQHIEPAHIENIPVPIFPEAKQQEIHNLIIESANLRVEANRLLEKAIDLFEEHIGKSEFSFNYQTKVLKMNERNLFSNRLDAQFAIAQEEIKKEKKAIEYISINSIASNIFVGNRAKRNYVEDGIPFLSSSDMMLFNPIRYAKQISKKSPNLDSLQVSKGDILISRSGTIGNTVLVGNILSGSAISEHALRLVINKDKMAPEYVYCYLNTEQGKRLMECSAYGSVIITLNEDYVGGILLPILEEEQKTEIIENIRNYSLKMDNATIKENQAISLVEKEIESWQQS